MGKETDQSKESIEKAFLGFTEAQEFLDVSHATIYRLMKQGLPSHKIGKKRVFFKEDLLQWIREH
jgi:excisionase family DNA binding protein